MKKLFTAPMGDGRDFDPPLDPGIAPIVLALRGAGIETFESCEGGDGHAYPEPTVRFYGERSEGFKALAVALGCGFKVKELRRVWPVLDGEPTGPWWELTFVPARKTDQSRKFFTRSVKLEGKVKKMLTAKSRRFEYPGYK